MFEEYFDNTWIAAAQKRMKEEIPQLDTLLKAEYRKKKTITAELCSDHRDLFDSEAAYERYLLIAATKIAMLDVYDFKFGVDIASAQSNIERTQPNAEDIIKHLEKDILPAYKGLSERLQLIARLNWYSIIYRDVETISKIRGAMHDQKTLLFFRTLNLKEKWDKAAGEYRAKENETTEELKQPSFDQWMTDFEEQLIKPQEALWKREEQRGAVIRRSKRAVRIVLCCFVAYMIISYAAGFGFVARYLHHLRPEAVTDTAEIDGFGTFEPADIADYNASSILGDGDDPLYTDRNLMDGDTATSWTEGEDDAGINRRLYFNIEKTGTVNYIVIWNGDQSSEENFKAHNRIKQLTLKINDTRHQYTINLEDKMGPQYIRVEREDVDKLWLIIDSVYEGENGEDETSVSEVEIY